MSKSKHLSKIDMRGVVKAEDECPFLGMMCVRCAEIYENNPSTWNNYVCECIKEEPAPQSRRLTNESKMQLV